MDDHVGVPHPFEAPREYGGWSLRPERGWRGVRWITPPLYYTREIPASDRDGACDWAMEMFGMPVSEQNPGA